ncbi:MAG: hypothetical protein ACTTJ3_04055 [Treponema sp.]
MLSNRKKRIIEICAFILTLSFSLIIFNPLSSYIEKLIAEKKQMLISMIGEKTGIGFDYASISPSILKQIVIKNISVFDYTSKEAIGNVKQIKIEYNILSLLFGDYEDIIKYIRVHDAHLTIDRIKNKILIEKLSLLAKKNSEENNLEKEIENLNNTQENKLKIFFSDLKPLEVIISNCSLTLKDENENGEGRLLNITVSSGNAKVREKDCYFSLSSSATYQTYKVDTINKILQNIDVSLFTEGEVKKDFSKAFCRANLSANHSEIGKSQTISLFASYENDILSVSNLKINPRNNFNISWNTISNEITGNIKCTSFEPFSIFSFTNSNYSQFKKTSISCDTNFHFKDLNTWNFDTNLNLNLPSFKLNGYNFDAINLKTITDGKDGNINISSLNISERRLEAFLKGKYDLNTQTTSGNLNISRLTLPTEESLSTNLFFNGNKQAYKVSAPYVKTGGQTLENIKFSLLPRGNKYYFYFDAKDDSGKYSVDGSLLLAQNKFLEFHTTLDSVKAGTILGIARNATPLANKLPNALVKVIEDTQITTEAYISTDFKNYSYNFVQIIFASIASDSFFATFQLNGNNSSVLVEKINLLAGNIDMTGRTQAYFENDGASFDAFFSINSIAYNISAIYVDHALSIYGDYGITINMFLKDETLRGALTINELPIPLLDSIFSIDSSFEIANLDDWKFECNLLKLTRMQETLQRYDSYDFEMKGSGNNNKIFFNEIRLISNELPLLGFLDINFDYSKDNETKTLAKLVLKNETTNELFTIDSNFTKADKFYFDGTIEAKNIALMRFFRNQTIRNTTSAEFNFLGSLDDFFVKLDLYSFNLSKGGQDILVKGSFSADDSTVRIETCDVEWGNHKIKDIEAKLLPFDAIGNLILGYDGKLGINEIKTGLTLSYSGGNKTEYGKENIFVTFPRLLSNFSIECLFSDIEYGNKLTVDHLNAVLVKEPGVLALSLGNNDEVYGVYLDDGTVSLHVDEKLPIRCNIDGKITNEKIDLNCLALNVDVPLIWNLTPLIDTVSFESGTLIGDIKILGTKKEPEFYSSLKCMKVKATSPLYAPELYGPVDIDVNLNATTLTVPYTIVKGPSAKLYASVTSEFSGWFPSDIIIKCGTLKNSMALMKTKNLAYHSDGYAGCDLTITISPGEVYLAGKANFDNGFFSIPFNDLHKIGQGSKGSTAFRMNLDVYLGKKAEYRWPNNEIPILRALVPSEKPISLSVDSSIGYFDIKGASNIRGGEIFYIKRNFYIREGNINFVATPLGFEPLVSLRAEIRDKDESGEPIKIILSAKDQNLENFTPKLETYPPRSETAIMQMLGQVFIGNVSRENFLQTALTTATDLVAQIGVFKKTESKIRDLLHVDAFSMRTLLIQNAIFGNLFRANTGTPLTIGNYFDNTSVYIGKYFGSQIYADALLHLSYYDPLLARGNITRKPVYGNLLFMPELGLEMATPFFLLRSSISPTRSDTLFVSDTKLTFSWKFSY